jgi:hypothetical protein
VHEQSPTVDIVMRGKRSRQTSNKVRPRVRVSTVGILTCTAY